MTPPPEITFDDFTRFIQSSFFHKGGQSEEEFEAWLEENGLSRELLDDIGDAMVDNFIYRLLNAEGVPIMNIIIYNVSLTAFQLGWEAAREFAQQTRIE